MPLHVERPNLPHLHPRPNPLRRVGLLLLLLAACDRDRGTPPTPDASPAACDGAVESASGLPLPHTLRQPEYDKLLLGFLRANRHRFLGWAKDKRIRDTGPYANDKNFGTHPAVRVYYSPAIIQWLSNGRAGCIPDGAVIVKEMFKAPAARHNRDATPGAWSVMVRDSAGAKDGWYWAEYENKSHSTTDTSYPGAGFGHYCVNCHASAARALTFATLANVEGFPGEPIDYLVDDSWKTPKEKLAPSASESLVTETHHALGPQIQAAHVSEKAKEPLARSLNQAFKTRFAYPSLAVALTDVVRLPPEPQDRVPQRPDMSRTFVTSDQCMGCHDGDVAAARKGTDTDPGIMVVVDTSEKSTRRNVAPYGEWRWSMMGLSGRDPIFLAQLESEQSRLRGAPGEFGAKRIADLCMKCHAPMGQRQLAADRAANAALADAYDDAVLMSGEGSPLSVYGGLGRDGVSCAVCHQLVEGAPRPLSERATGNVTFAKRIEGQPQPIFGPRDAPVEWPMTEALGMKPVKDAFISTSSVCGPCHMVRLPVVDGSGNTVDHSYEQATYLEWLNSEYAQREREGERERSSCQSCHMPRHHRGTRIDDKIATVQDRDFADYEHPEHIVGAYAPVASVDVRPRQGVARHQLGGVNVLGLELFNQFPDHLGVRKNNYMTGIDDGLPAVIRSTREFARSAASIRLADVRREGRRVVATVEINNLTGHRLPTGVGFRRVFVEFLVKNETGDVVWASGRTDELGFVLDGTTQRVLQSENRADHPYDEKFMQPHFDRIARGSDVQIYEEVNTGVDGRFTTSFLNIARHVKDNRLLPRGWRPDGTREMGEPERKAVQPKMAPDGNFTGGGDRVEYSAAIESSRNSRKLRVEVRLYYQSAPPGYLHDRFAGAAGSHTKRLYALLSHLDTKEAKFDGGWKILIAEDAADVPPGR